MKNLVATNPLSALSGLKFPEIGGQIADENFNFAAEVMWNENIDQMLENLKKNDLSDKELQKKKKNNTNSRNFVKNDHASFFESSIFRKGKR